MPGGRYTGYPLSFRAPTYVQFFMSSHKAGHQCVQRLRIFVSSPSQTLLPSCYTINRSGCTIAQVFFLLPSHALGFLRSCRLLIFCSPLLPPNLFDKCNAAAKAAVQPNDAICQSPPGVLKPAGAQKYKRMPLKKE